MPASASILTLARRLIRRSERRSAALRGRPLVWTCLAVGVGLAVACGSSRPAAPRASEAATSAGNEPDRFADLRGAAPVLPDGLLLRAPAAQDAGRPAPTVSGSTAGTGAGSGAGSGAGAATAAGPGSGRAAGTDAASAGRPVAALDADVVAHVVVDLPLERPVHVRACVPVPAGFELPVERALVPMATSLALEAPDGTLVPCQIEVVTRGPSGAPEVIEVIAPLFASARAVGAPSGATHARTTLALRRGAFELPTNLGLDEAVAALFANGPCALTARDALGNEYRADLLQPVAREVTSRGPYLRRIRAAAVMRYVPDERALESNSAIYDARIADAARQALPHLFGVHAHFSLLAGDPRISLDLRVHAGLTSGAATDTDDDSPVGAIWFRALDVELPATWTTDAQFPDPAFGRERVEDGRSRRPLVQALEQNYHHFVPPSAQFVRRVVLRPRDADGGAPMWEGLGLVAPDTERWSWGSAATARYFPQRATLPSWEALDGARPGGAGALRAWLVARRDALAATVRTGLADGNRVRRGALGWFHPWFYSYQGATGGADITLVEGHLGAAVAERADVEWLALVHQMNVCRQPVAQWLADGRPAGVEAWVDADGRVPFEFYMDARNEPPELRLPALGGFAPAAHLAAIAQHGRRPVSDQGEPFARGGAIPGDDSAIVAWMAHDAQHLVRFTKNAKALAWLAADRLAIDDLRMEAERFRLMVHGATPPGPRGATLSHLEGRAAQQPHTGLPIDRAHAWGIDAAAAAYALSDDGFRVRFLPWLERYTDVLLAGLMPNGLVMRIHYKGVLDGRFDAAQSYQIAFLLQARRALVESVFRGVDAARTKALQESFLAGVDYLYFGPPFQRVIDRWSKGERVAGPSSQFAVAPRAADGGESDLLPYCYAERWGPDFLPEGGRVPDSIDTTYPWDVLTYAEAWARELGRAAPERYLERTLALGRQAASPAELVQRMRLEDGRSDLSASGNRAAFLARIQALGLR
ncbi:MAG: hypothetical protein R3F49_00200 [Planctomycetota bacterium]